MKFPFDEEKGNPMKSQAASLLGLAVFSLFLTGLGPLDEKLITAAEKGALGQVEELLKKGARVNAADKKGWTPLHVAAVLGHEAVVRLLLDKGAQVNAASQAGETPLHLGAVEGNEAVVRLLLEKGAQVNAAAKEGSTPLHGAAGRGHEIVVRLLLENKANVSARDQLGRTPLHIGVLGGNPDVLSLLLSHDAYLEVKDNDGITPLDYARENGLASVVRVLEEAQAGQGPVGRLSPPVSPAPRSEVDAPPAVKVKTRPAAYAVVVGIEQYRNHIPPARFAARDAKVVGEYLSRVMGYRDEHVTVLLNDRAAKADLEKYVEHWLPNRVEPDASVFVYFSGHGAPNPKTGEAYLVPFDGDPAFVEATGYPLKRLYENLGKLPAKEVVVVLDSCFSGAGGRSVIAKGMRPVGLSMENPFLAGGKTVALTASSGSQVSGTYDQQGHGLLTYFVLKGLRGEADRNRDGAIELAELFDYGKPQVERTARREFNLEQTPQLLGAPDLLAKGIRLVERVGP